MDLLYSENILITVQLIGMLTLGIVALFTKKSKKNIKEISEVELSTYLQQYQPENLVENDEIFAEPFIPSMITNKINNSFKTVQNLCITDYYCLRNAKDSISVANNCINVNGVGSCGPRGFYGTIDVHLSLEDQLAEFMQLEETILYSYNLSTMSSAIIAYCKKGDIMFCDEEVTETSIEAVKAAKATIVYFKHNDMFDLERQLQKYISKSNKVRMFMLVEGIYQQTGKICNLPRLMELRKAYKLRMFLDETISFGSLGTCGRGITDYYNVDRTDIDLITGSLEHSVPSIGGFCIGSSFVIDHQRLSGLGYCFSASLPPLHSYLAKHAIRLFQSKPEIIKQLNQVAVDAHEKLSQLNGIVLISDKHSPLKVFQLKDNACEFKEKAKHVGLLLNAENKNNRISFNVNVNMDDKYIETLSNTLNWLLDN